MLKTDGDLHHDLERRPNVKSSLACPALAKVKQRVGYGRAASSDFSIHVQ